MWIPFYKPPGWTRQPRTDGQRGVTAKWSGHMDHNDGSLSLLLDPFPSILESLPWGGRGKHDLIHFMSPYFMFPKSPYQSCLVLPQSLFFWYSSKWLWRRLCWDHANTTGGKRRFKSENQVPLTEFQISEGVTFPLWLHHPPLVFCFY